MQPDMIGTVVIGGMLAMFTALLAWQNKRGFDAVERRVAEAKAELKAEDSPIRTELVSIHATLVQVALAVNPQTRPEAG